MSFLFIIISLYLIINFLSLYTIQNKMTNVNNSIIKLKDNLDNVMIKIFMKKLKILKK
jgi:hypothetical protein